MQGGEELVVSGYKEKALLRAACQGDWTILRGGFLEGTGEERVINRVEGDTIYE